MHGYTMTKSHHITVDPEPWDAFNALRNKYNLSWNAVYARFAIYQSGVEYIFNAPGTMTKELQLDLRTAMGLTSLWMDNLRRNWELIHSSKFVDSMPKHIGKSAIIVGAGQSAVKHDHYRMIAESDFQKNGGIVISTSHSLLDCLEAGLIPDITATIDGDMILSNFIDHDLVRKYMDKIAHVFTTSIHPKMLETWTGKNKYFFRSVIPQDLIPNVENFLGIMLPDVPLLNTTGNCGGFCYCLASYLGCTTIGFVGMDLGYTKDYPYEDTEYWAAYMASVGTAYESVEQMKSICYIDYHNKAHDIDCYTDFVYNTFAKSILAYIKIQQSITPAQRVINATEGGVLEGDNIEGMTLENFLKLNHSGDK